MIAVEVQLEPADNERLANLCGPFDEHLRLLERRTGVGIGNRGNTFQLTGEDEAVRGAEQVIRQLYDLTASRSLSAGDVHLELSGNSHHTGAAAVDEELIRTRRVLIRARGTNQQRYLEAIRQNDISFGIGPAGTGKTYLAVASAVAALESDSVRRVCLVRPAVEAGERLGFLPGDMAQKIDPYLRPLYDALYEMLGFERVAKLIERNVIEVAPLAFMRGRTLNESFIILDEAQNTTIEQMKMFLTRIGFGSRAVVTGDVTQIDLPRGKASGLRHVMNILDRVQGISFTHFQSRDVVRHTLVAKILDAYAAYEAAEGAGDEGGR